MTSEELIRQRIDDQPGFGPRPLPRPGEGTISFAELLEQAAQDRESYAERSVAKARGELDEPERPAPRHRSLSPSFDDSPVPELER